MRNVHPVVIWLCACGPPQATWPEAGLLLPEVDVVDADGARGPRWILVADGAIAAVLDADPGTPPDGVDTLDVAGRTVTPGLVDPHTHLFASGATVDVGDTLLANLRAQLRSGVTTVVDAGGPDAATHLATRSRTRGWTGPTVRALSPFVTVPRSHPCEVWNDPTRCVYVEAPGDGARLATAAVAAGFDGVKVAIADTSGTPWPTPRLAPTEAAGAFATARAAGLLAYAHVDTEQDALDALDGGAGHLAHPVFLGPRTPAGTTAIATGAAAVHTTVGAFDGVGRLLDDAVDWEALDGLVPGVVRANWAAIRDDPALLEPGFADASAAWAQGARGSLADLDAAGARILPASDAGYLFVPHGAGLHHELGVLRTLGWEPLRILTAATADAAAAVDLPDRGRVAPGQRADLLVVDGDPLGDLGVLARPRWVIVGGHPWSQAALGSWSPPDGDTPGFCIGDDDCPTGRCDGWTHTCQPACDVAWRVDDGCGPDATCVPGEAAPVCRPLRTCDLDAPACAPAAFGEACVPVDRDTATCWPAGPRAEGEACGALDPATFCAAGLTCSAVDATCYRLCDPAAPSCGPDTTCQTVWVDERPWYALCLP